MVEVLSSVTLLMFGISNKCEILQWVPTGSIRTDATKSMKLSLRALSGSFWCW